MTDYLILGGGLAGCALASRLKEYLPDASVTVIEAGPDEHENPLLVEPMGTMQLANSMYQYNYTTAPQRHYDGRRMFHAGGKVLSGSSSVNYAAWTRGDRADYDLWASTVNDERWSYNGQLPFFRKTETHHDPSADPGQHGFSGPVHTTPALSRTYPLTERVRQAYDSIGIKYNPEHNAGDNKGIAPYVENWYDGKRQPAGKAYGLRGVEVLTNSAVARILFAEDGGDGGDAGGARKRAVGVELTSGKTINASKEVILCCGAIRSPQVLLLSGIGPAAELQRHSIPQILENPHVGRNFHEHCAMIQYFKLRDSAAGYCAPSPAFNHPSFTRGFPTDYVIMESAPTEDLIKALAADNGDEAVNDRHPHVYPPRSHYELLPMYAPVEVPLTDLAIPTDGSIVSVGVVNILPTSRGSVTLRSADRLADPEIDPNYFATETDRVVLRAAVRRNLAAFESPALSDAIQGEVPPPGFPNLTSRSSDAEIDARIRRAAATFCHGAGSVAMGKAVDTECRLIGVDGLRVVDASVLPVPISAHYQVPVYALAEQMARIIADAR